MNFSIRTIPALAFFTLAAVAVRPASAQVPTAPPAGTPVTIQSQAGADGRTAYSVAIPGSGLAAQEAAAASGITGTSGVTRQVPQDFKLVSGDVITVRVFDQDYNAAVVIDKDGFVDLPYLGQTQLSNVTIRAAADLISSRLVQAGIYNHPIVLIQFVDGPGTDASVLGELHGSVPIFNQRPLLDVISALGGFPSTASHVVTINRAGHEPMVIDLGTEPTTSPLANTPVFPGDTIITGRAGVVFVVGAFKSPGVIPLTGNQVTTLLELSATTGGPLFSAKYKDLRLIRVVDGKRTLVTLDIERILLGKDPDPILKSNDILFLPTSPMKAFIAANGAQSVISMASSLVAIAAFTR